MWKIIVIILIAGAGYLNYTNPTIDDHRDFVLEEMGIGYTIPDDVYERIWADVDFSSFFVASFMKTSEDSTMITSGYLNNLKIVNKKWLEKKKAQIEERMDRF